MKKEFLKNVFKISKNDAKEIVKNKILLIIVLGLVLLPSLYAWFNIKAFWDPYGNTKYLKVAVVNEDMGDTFKNENLKLGEKVVDNLKENKLLDWQFVDKEEAEEGLLSGEYYAVIDIPQEFSSDILSITKPEVKKATIKYSVNEKTNAIAPKITDKGADAIQSKIGKAIVEIISESTLTTLGGVSNSVDVSKDLEKTKEILENLDKQLGNVENIISSSGKSLDLLQGNIKNAKDALPNLDKTISDTKDLNKNFKKSLENNKDNFNKIGKSIRDDFVLINSTHEQNQILMNEAFDLINNRKDSIDTLNRLQIKVEYSKINTQNIINILNYINILDRPLLKDGIKLLEDYSSLLNKYSAKIRDLETVIRNGQEVNNNLKTEINNISNNINEKSKNILENFDDKITLPINNISSSIGNLSNDIDSIITSVSNLYPNLSSTFGNISNTSSNIKSTSNMASTSILLLRSQIKSSLDTVNNLQNSSEFNHFNEVIKSNVMNRVDFLKSPVELDTNRIYSIENYGSAMTPFYSVLATWVGGLILCAVLSTKTHENYTHREEYVGRGILFLILALFQSLIISMGDFFILGVTVKNPVLFVLVLMFSSMVFISIIYSLVSIFNNVGKAIAIFLLVIQIGGSGGTFPIQMTPPFFKAINTIIPFTYAIGACREAVGGIYMPNLIKDLIVLLAFMLITLALSLIFKGPVNKLANPFNKKLNSSHLIGH